MEERGEKGPKAMLIANDMGTKCHMAAGHDLEQPDVALILPRAGLTLHASRAPYCHLLVLGQYEIATPAQMWPQHQPALSSTFLVTLL